MVQALGVFGIRLNVFRTDTNNIIVLYPQAIADNSIHTIASGTVLSNPNACFDWVGWYGSNYDQHGGESGDLQLWLDC